MELFPAIDLIEGCAVRLVHGDYAQKTVYSTDPLAVAQGFLAAGAKYLHVVDLEGAKSGGTPNFKTIEQLVSCGLQAEVGGGVREEEVVRRYLDAGAYRVILGTAAVGDPDFLARMIARFGSRIAVGVDVKDGMVAVKGWTELSDWTAFGFCARLQELGARTVICTDISKDGLLGGANHALYEELTRRFSMGFIASGGVSTLEDVRALKALGLSGAILGKALYTGGLDLAEALRAAKEEA